MCTVLLPPGDNPIAVNKYIISYYIICICIKPLHLGVRTIQNKLVFGVLFSLYRAFPYN